jgi:hypothetical protein
MNSAFAIGFPDRGSRRPWRFATYSDKGKGRSAEAHYDCLTIGGRSVSKAVAGVDRPRYNM